MMNSSTAKMKFAVIGAGVVGLSTALQLQQELPSAAVTVIADKFGRDTTSDGAAGTLRPVASKTPGVPHNVFRQWMKDSWRHYHQLAHSEDAGEAGCKVVTGLELYNTPQDNQLQEEILYYHAPCQPEELEIYPGPNFKYGYKFTSLMIECRQYIPYLTKKFKANGGQIENRRIISLSELVGCYDLVIVCAGLGAKELLGDNKIYPIRGHLIRVKAPWLKHFIYTEDENHTCTYIYPGQNNVVIGGTRQMNDEDPHPRIQDRDDVWERACKVVPSLKKAEVLWDWVGFRPTRAPLRLEKETIRFDNGDLQVVHNYGHGGDGIALSWGTSKAAVELVKQSLKCSNKFIIKSQL